MLLDTKELVETFVSLEKAKTKSDKLDSLLKAKQHILNVMSKEQIFSFFVNEPANFENMYMLEIWTKSLDGDDHNGGIVEFVEPYDIIEKIFASFDNLNQLIDLFHKQIIFLLHQNKDEKSKHICVKHMIRLSKNLEKCRMNADPVSLVNNLRDPLEKNLKEILPYFVQQIPVCIVSYSQLVNDLFCSLTIELNKLEAQIQSKDQLVDIFTCSVFENNQRLMNEFEQVYKMNSIQAFRIFEIIINMSMISEEHLKSICENKFNLNNKINSFLIEKCDMLSRLNCVELLSKLVRVSYGFDYLNKNMHLRHILNMLSELAEDPFGSIIIPSIVRLFSYIAHDRPRDILDSYPSYFDYLFKTALNEDVVNEQVSIILSFEIFTYLLDTNQLKKFIFENFRENFLNLLNRLVWILEFVINESLKVASLKCIAELISPDTTLLNTFHTNSKYLESPWLTTEWVDQSKQFYNLVTQMINHEKLFGIILKLARQPICQTRLAAQLYFKALAQTKWGIHLIFEPNNYNGYETFFLGYLLNRSVEMEKEGLESKFEMINLIMSNFNLNNESTYLIGQDGMNQLKQYIQDGPFYMKAQLNVDYKQS